ncbi:MAG: peptidylprolyl isomerase [Luteolibacter sp.]|uniref:peptidylprolyl isomerase n=1 Tax=Luteolibacter sp. TaxID=1962973 RepID=UPI003263B598
MPLRRLFPSIFLSVLCAIGEANAEDTSTPAAPSDLQVTPVGVNSFKLKWKDNSTNELGWDVRISLKGGAPQHFLYIPTKDITSYTVITNDLPGFGLVFQLAAYNGAAGAEKISALTPSVVVRALSPATFAPATGLTATTLDDGRIRLVWTDNSTSEGGYLIQLKNPSAKIWKTLGTTQPDVKFNVVATGMLPSKSYQFRVRAFRGTKLTGPSNIAAATTKSLQAPENLEVTADVEGSFKFKWKDRSSAESGFEIQQKTGTGEFAWSWRFGTNTTSTEVLKNFPLDTDIQFRIRSYRMVGTEFSYSGFSNVVSTRSTPLAKATLVAMTARTDSSLTVKWKDNSTRETNYQIEYRKVGTSTFSSKYTEAGIETYTITGLDAGQNYDIRVHAVAADFFSASYSPSSGLIQAKTKDGVGGDLSPLLSIGAAFSYQVHITDTALLTGVTVTGLPDGLTYDSVTRTVSGTVDHDGTFALTVTATFSDGTTSIRTVNVRTTSPPVIAATFGAKTLAVAGTTVVSATGKFSDPDTVSAARFDTTSGQFDIIFFPNAAPLTVDNFIDYMDAGEYDNMFFHRAPTNFVVQGGGYKYTADDGFTKIPHFDPVVNEPGISNLRGTVAMAKLGGLPNSATSEWFVNVKDNSANLDVQNGGFTVFGRVPSKGMVVIDKIKNLPIDDYDITVDGGTQILEDVPIDDATAPAVLDPTKLVKVTSSGPAPILTYEVISQQPAIATATLTGTDITVTGVAAGTATIQVKATDLDGNTVTQTFTVTVS